jgi:hypothetical protein
MTTRQLSICLKFEKKRREEKRGEERRKRLVTGDG